VVLRLWSCVDISETQPGRSELVPPPIQRSFSPPIGHRRRARISKIRALVSDEPLGAEGLLSGTRPNPDREGSRRNDDLGEAVLLSHGWSGLDKRLEDPAVPRVHCPLELVDERLS
jgi:hypothetical protein